MSVWQKENIGRLKLEDRRVKIELPAKYMRIEAQEAFKRQKELVMKQAHRKVYDEQASELL